MFADTMQVTHEPFLPGARDAHGDDVDAWGDPVQVPVYGVGPASQDEAIREQMTGVATRLTVYCSEGFASHRDRVTIPGDPAPFEVVGYPQNYNLGPFGWAPGFTIALRRVDG